MQGVNVYMEQNTADDAVTRARIHLIPPFPIQEIPSLPNLCFRRIFLPTCLPLIHGAVSTPSPRVLQVPARLCQPIATRWHLSSFPLTTQSSGIRLRSHKRTGET